jgi:hypothetical protein
LAANVGQGSLIKIIGYEEKSILAAKFGERLRDSLGNAIVRDWDRGCRICRKADASLDLLIEAHVFGMRAATVYMLLCKHGSEPAFEGTAPSVIVEL